MKRIYSVFAMLLVLGVLTACGSSNNVNASSETGNQSTAAAVPESTVSAVEEAATSSAPLEAAVPQSVAESDQTNGTLIGEEEAKRIALEDAGVAEGDISGLLIHLDMDDGVQEYEVEFYSGTEEYDYEIHAADGTIRSKDREIENLVPPDAAQTESGAAITEEDVIALVLEKVPGATEDQIRIHMDRDDGVTIYEGSLVYDGTEYDFEIHGQTGEVLEWEAERHR